MPENLADLTAAIRACRICRDTPAGAPLPHEPRPVLRVSSAARIAVCGQAPGVRVHASGKPFTDPSGVRLRAWMGVSEEEFYDETRVAIVPMGFCFPGANAKGADLPPRKECAAAWHKRLFRVLPRFEMLLAVGSYAQNWHINGATGAGLTATMLRWRDFAHQQPVIVPLPHPSWRNNAWLKQNPWFEAGLVPWLQVRIRALL
jgi:uracil-DNA glycosylase